MLVKMRVDPIQTRFKQFLVCIDNLKIMGGDSVDRFYESATSSHKLVFLTDQINRQIKRYG